ncbi:cupin [Streptococcus pseudopneumoniae]|nr:cupin domain-containing protein [Streptococcus pseudopneumoniae]MBW8116611.1 cupin domain-containing protein [Streptococcus pseudopneumoniae]NIB63592.1 cupin [Streptococcus pseudopneumoniae]NIB76721.1 cupin [Streptococcus pseudopneumoniae]NIB77744.1 cupin [Streptococcus pseudopneumoniae]
MTVSSELRGVLEVDKDYALVSCLVAPGFEFEDFELFERVDLLATYLEHKEMIERLTRS